ncbi:probable complex I intermediate-associated protein 30 isoform X2 [Cryptomeria japonica]|uniref:probable complex I intermediate-associated protein 30 isoform X2 n=1 Tax=Cryptomeria japonica TaxID=3369 RepID=UPI0027DAAD9B|nr:probable complex I intermediate-associated protein 30 isoform X2 [Cryptomeria japonica]
MSRFRALWQSSLKATRKALSWKLEDLTPPTETEIFSFRSKDDLRRWKLYADSEYGGLSSASLEIKATGVFSGHLSSEMSQDSRWVMNRSGFCGMRSTQSEGYLDLEPYDTLALRVRGDGRCYISTIHTENWVNVPGGAEDNTWQAYVFVPKGDWYIAKIPLVRYLPTWRGNVMDSHLEMNPSRIVGMSLSINAEGGPQGAVTGPGEFRLEVDWIKALRTT